MSLNIKNGDQLIPVAGTPKVTRSSLELENVDNTADLDKPVSTATQAALDLKADITDLDKKANKTFIDSVDSETHVVTVPDDVAGFAAISNISGKTVKLNLFNMDEFIKVDTDNITKINDKSFQIKGAWYKELNITLKPLTKYTLSIKVDSSSVQAAAIVTDTSGASIMGESLKVTGSTTFTTTSETSYKIRFYSGNATPGTSVYSNVQLEEGTVVHPYAPFGLISAPIKSVVSKSENKFDSDLVTKNGITPTGDIDVNDSLYLSELMKVNGDFSVFWNKSNGGYMRIAFYDNTQKFIRREDINASTSNFFTKSNVGYIRICFEIANINKESISVYNGSENKGYIPLNKTTFDGAELPTSVGKNILSVDTDVIPAKVEAVTFGDYYSKAEVDKMVPKIEYGTITSNTGNIDTAKTFCIKSGNIVTFRARITECTVDRNWGDICILPFKPNKDTCSINIEGGMSAVWAQSDGTIARYPTISNATLDINGTYITND